MKTILVVPVKGGALQKSRLAEALSPEARQDLVSRMARHVLAEAAKAVGAENVVLLSPAPIEGAAHWRQDQGRGLNEELAAFRAEEGDAVFVVVSADLPFVDAAEIADLVGAARSGAIALAPNRDETGTNAIALPAGAPFAFSFGADSFARHRALAGDRVEAVRRAGLAFDIDTPADLAAAKRVGFP